MSRIAEELAVTPWSYEAGVDIIFQEASRLLNRITARLQLLWHAPMDEAVWRRKLAYAGLMNRFCWFLFGMKAVHKGSLTFMCVPSMDVLQMHAIVGSLLYVAHAALNKTTICGGWYRNTVVGLRSGIMCIKNLFPTESSLYLLYMGMQVPLIP